MENKGDAETSGRRLERSTDCEAPPDLGPPRPVADIATVLQALADPTRLALVRSLATSDQPRACCSLGSTVTKSTMSHHFRVLREAGIIEQRLAGTRKLTSLRRRELEAAFPGLIGSVVGAAAGSERDGPSAGTAAC